MNCIPPTSFESDVLVVQAFAVVLDDAGGHTLVRLCNLSTAHQTTETIANISRSAYALASAALHPSGAILYVADGTQIMSLNLTRPFSSALTVLAGGSAAGNQDAVLGVASTFSGITKLVAAQDGATLFVVDQSRTVVRTVQTDTGQTRLRWSTATQLVWDIDVPRDGSVVLMAVSDNAQAAWKLQSFSATSMQSPYSKQSTSTSSLMPSPDQSPAPSPASSAMRSAREQSQNSRRLLASSPATTDVAVFGSARIYAVATSADQAGNTIAYVFTSASLYSVSLATGTAALVLSDARLASVSSASTAVFPGRVWALSSTARAFYQLSNGTFENQFGSSARAGAADDTTRGALHYESFASPVALAVWRPRKPGYDCVSSNETVSPCDRGRASQGSLPCLLCARGYASSQLAAAECSPCPSGTYADQSGSLACTPCPAPSCGPAQYYSQCGGDSGGACAPCQRDCPADQFRQNCSGYSQGNCAPCQPPPASGKYFSGTSECAVSDCANAPPPGFFWSGPGYLNGTCPTSACPPKPAAGYFTQACSYRCWDGYGGAQCGPCGQGNFSTYPGTPACARCPRGTFSSAQASAACQPCPPGSACPSEGSQAPSQCGPGTFSASQAASACSACPPGSYSPQNSTACAQCALGQIANVSSCSSCAAGTFSASPADTACAQCAPGSVSAEARTSCTACDPGTFANASQCSQCPAGTFSAAAAATACASCVQGVHYPANSTLVQAPQARACDFQCGAGLTRVVELPFDACANLFARPSFAFVLRVQAAELLAAQVQWYRQLVSTLLGISQARIRVARANPRRSLQSSRRLLQQDQDLYMAIESDSDNITIILAKEILKYEFQLLVTQQIMASSPPQAPATVLTTSLDYLVIAPENLAQAPVPAPPAPAPAPPLGVISPPPAFKSEAADTQQDACTSAVLIAFLTLLTLAYVLPADFEE